jgi:hypothetical protein
MYFLDLFFSCWKMMMGFILVLANGRGRNNAGLWEMVYSPNKEKGWSAASHFI